MANTLGSAQFSMQRTISNCIRLIMIFPQPHSSDWKLLIAITVHILESCLIGRNNHQL